MEKVTVTVIDIGRQTFLKALQFQRNCAAQALSAVRCQQYESRNHVLLVEHPPVYTIGLRRGPYTEQDEKRLRDLGADFQRTDRGGLITFHGPGQMVVYPVIYLKDFNLTMRNYIKKLEETIIDLCGGLGIDANTSPDTGVWVGNNKIAAIGVHGSRYITTHGVALNCNTDLTWFKHIVPCGIEHKGVTSLTEQLNRVVTREDSASPLLRAFAHNFNCDLSFCSLEDSGLS